jgi:hypothetical protein
VKLVADPIIWVDVSNVMKDPKLGISIASTLQSLSIKLPVFQVLRNLTNWPYDLSRMGALAIFSQAVLTLKRSKGILPAQKPETTI